jgi:hypothetical protein
LFNSIATWVTADVNSEQIADISFGVLGITGIGGRFL